MKFSKHTLLINSLLLACMAGCMKKENFPDTPEIGFVSYTNVFSTGTFATNGILTFSFQDGNGDIGLSDRDTLSPYNRDGLYYYNLVVDYYEKQYGVYQKIDLSFPLSSRIPRLSLESGKAIKGTITDTLVLDPHPDFDTVRFEVFIYDRALHKSNVITTPDIILRKP
jgi:hypothetical protein